MSNDEVPADGRRVQARNDPGRKESEEERQDRNLSELLQELRVAGIGIQVLFGFLLSLPFSTRFGKLDDPQRHLYVVTLVLAAVAIGLLSAPVAYHRLVFRQHKKARLLRVTNNMALAGLAVVGLAISSAVLLVTGVVLRGIAVPVISASVVGMFFVLWFLVPLVSGRFDERVHRQPGAR
jgi:putative flippase GtrA